MVVAPCDGLFVKAETMGYIFTRSYEASMEVFSTWEGESCQRSESQIESSDYIECLAEYLNGVTCY